MRRCHAGVEEAAQPAHRVGLRDRAASAVDDAGFGHAAGRNGVVLADVTGAHDALHLHQFVALVQPQVLLPLHDQVAVGQALHYGDRDAALQPVALRAVALAGEITLAGRRRAEDVLAAQGDRRTEERGRPQVEVRLLVGGGVGTGLRSGVLQQGDA
ncbi:hypothetical protein G6F65_014160 [Rhizopus arrhizus]|nr:hypothetical protein G6F65_014160 [Rhizopus arrhizus]